MSSETKAIQVVRNVGTGEVVGMAIAEAAGFLALYLAGVGGVVYQIALAAGYFG